MLQSGHSRQIRQTRARRAAKWLTLGCLGGSLTASGGEPSALVEVPVTLTISGGASLGNYEAGFNWALTRLLKEIRRSGGFTVGKGGLLGSANTSEVHYAPQLNSVTGASAGSINSLLTAIAWCQNAEADAQETLTDNLYWHVWTNIGISDLFPSNMSCEAYRQDMLERHGPSCDARYAQAPELKKLCRERLLARVTCDGASPYRVDGSKLPTDQGGLLTRNGFAPAEAFLETELNRPDRYTPGCQVPLGMTTSSTDPILTPLEGDGKGQNLEIETLRYAAMVESYSCPDGLCFTQYQRFVPAAPTFGAEFGVVMDLDGLGFVRATGEPPTSLKLDKVLSVLYASSAFPLAFAPVSTQYLQKDNTYLVDGGVFDNVPLSLAYSMVADEAARGQLPVNGVGGDSVRLLYVDPGRTRDVIVQADRPLSALQAQALKAQARALVRDPAQEPPPTTDKDKPGLSMIMDFFLGDFVSVARSYELQALARFAWDKAPAGWPAGQWNPRLDMSTRFSPVVGQYLEAFGAFMAEPFRQYDYRAGVYDAIHNLSANHCGLVQDAATQEQLTCQLKTMRDLYQHLGKLDGDSRYVLNRLCEREFGLGVAFESTTDWKKEGSLISRRLSERAVWLTSDGKNGAKASFDSLVKNLFAGEGQTALDQLMPLEKEALENFDTWLNRTMVLMAGRQRSIESTNSRTSRQVADGLVLASVINESLYRDGFQGAVKYLGNDHLTWDSAVARWILPQQLMFDVRQGGIELGYPLTWISPWGLGIQATGIPLLWSPVTQGAYGGASAAAVWRIPSPSLNRIELGARAMTSWNGVQAGNLPTYPALEANVQVLANQVRLGFLYCPQCNGPDETRFSFRIGFGSFRPLAYWFTRLALEPQ